MDVEEAALVDAVRRGDEMSFRTLYRAHTPSLFRFALRLTGGRDADAEDVMQDAWARAVAGLDGFEGRAGLRSWLATIVVRCASERTRAAKRDVGTRRAMEGEPARTHIAERVDLERAVAAMPFGYRSVLVLHDVEGFRHRDIAEMLGITEGTSKSQLSRARARLRSLLGESYARG